jgi:hypothetical protein
MAFANVRIIRPRMNDVLLPAIYSCAPRYARGRFTSTHDFRFGSDASVS